MAMTLKAFRDIPWRERRDLVEAALKLHLAGRADDLAAMIDGAEAAFLKRGAERTRQSRQREIRETLKLRGMMLRRYRGGFRVSLGDRDRTTIAFPSLEAVEAWLPPRQKGQPA